MKTRTLADLKQLERMQPFHPARSGTPEGTAAAGDLQEFLTQKERALFRLAMAMGAGAEVQVRTYTLRALETGWTPEEIHCMTQVATHTKVSPEALPASQWVADVLGAS